GHGFGEVTAAYVAGALSLDDAARIVALRSRALGRLTGRGTVAIVSLPPAELEPHIKRWGDRVTIAAHDGPSSTWLAGDPDVIDTLVAELSARPGDRADPSSRPGDRADSSSRPGDRADSADGARRLPFSFAPASPQIDTVRDEILASLDGIAPRPV